MVKTVGGRCSLQCPFFFTQLASYVGQLGGTLHFFFSLLFMNFEEVQLIHILIHCERAVYFYFLFYFFAR